MAAVVGFLRGWGVAVSVIPVRVGDVDVLATTVVVAGSEPTASVSQLAGRAGELFARAEDAIVGVAVSTAQVIGKAAARAARPDRVEVEFGLSFTAKGGIVIGGVSGEASLKVTLSYDAHRVSPGGGPGAGGGGQPGAAAP
jgi:hypothetical protein